MSMRGSIPTYFVDDLRSFGHWCGRRSEFDSFILGREVCMHVIKDSTPKAAKCRLSRLTAEADLLLLYAYLSSFLRRVRVYGVWILNTRCGWLPAGHLASQSVSRTEETRSWGIPAAHSRHFSDGSATSFEKTLRPQDPADRPTAPPTHADRALSCMYTGT